MAGDVCWGDTTGTRGAFPCVKACAGLAGQVLQGYRGLSLVLSGGV